MFLNCRLCGSENIKKELVLDNSPANISKLLGPEEKDQPINLSVYKCQDCSFVQLLDKLDCDFYDDYVMTITHSPQMNEFQLAQASNFVENYQLQDKKIIEVGCGDGNYLEQLLKCANNVYGIEPSKSFCKLAEGKGTMIYNGYTEASQDMPGAPYDAFITRQVLEHVPDVNDFLQGIKRSLSSGAVGLIEVPSIEQAIEHQRFFDFFPDHLNYFSEETLRYALEKNSFKVNEIKRAMNGEYLEAHVSLSTEKESKPVKSRAGLESLQNSVESLGSSLKQLIGKAKESNKKVAIWGAGAKGVTLLAVTRIKDGIEYIIDSDPHKKGLRLPVSHFLIFSPEILEETPVDIIIISALAYQEEIVKTLKEKLNFKGEIVILGKL